MNTTSTRGESQLTDNTATNIIREHELAREHAGQAVAHARRCGELLVDAKAQVTHGEWETWLAERCPEISLRTAQRYMRIARALPELSDDEATRVSQMPLRQALAAIAEPAPRHRDPDGRYPSALPEAGSFDVLLNRGQRHLLLVLADDKGVSVADLIGETVGPFSRDAAQLLALFLRLVWLDLFEDHHAAPILDFDLTGDAERLERHVAMRRATA